VDQPDLVTDLAALTSWNAGWGGLRAAVLGLGVTGFAAADTLTELGAEVLVVAGSASDHRRELLEAIGARFVQTVGSEVTGELTGFRPELVIASPGFHPDDALLLWAADRGI